MSNDEKVWTTVSEFFQAVAANGRTGGRMPWKIVTGLLDKSELRVGKVRKGEYGNMVLLFNKTDVAMVAYEHSTRYLRNAFHDISTLPKVRVRGKRQDTTVSSRRFFAPGMTYAIRSVELAKKNTLLAAAAARLFSLNRDGISYEKLEPLLRNVIKAYGGSSKPSSLAHSLKVAGVLVLDEVKDDEDSEDSED